jgi:chemotaxis protein methyltransferase CheR
MGMELNTATFKEIRNLIYEQTGIFFQDNKRYVLEGRLLGRLKERNCSSYEDYYNLLRFDAYRDRELTTLYDLVTTNETFFYRDLPQLQVFTDVIVPGVMNANGGSQQLRIWSAACSTGDEPYTLAIMLLEQPALAKWTIEILGSDISEANLAAARRGIYGRYAVRNVPPALLRKYFREEGGQYAIAETVKRLVKFVNLNLYDAARMKLIRGMDVIFCRNCLIYFDDKARRKIVKEFHDCLRPGGHLVIGFSETLHHVSDCFKLIQGHRSVVYQRV